MSQKLKKTEKKTEKSNEWKLRIDGLLSDVLHINSTLDRLEPHLSPEKFDTVEELRRKSEYIKMKLESLNTNDIEELEKYVSGYETKMPRYFGMINDLNKSAGKVLDI